MNFGRYSNPALYYGCTRNITVLLVLVLALLALETGPARAQSVDQRIVGVYTLKPYSVHGFELTGRLSYDCSGRMWAMLLPAHRDPITAQSTPEEYRDTMRGVVAYYGTYDIDRSTGRVIHHVEGASNPAWTGMDFVRWFRFEGSDLLISLDPDFNNPLLWKRLPESSCIDHNGR